MAIFLSHKPAKIGEQRQNDAGTTFTVSEESRISPYAQTLSDLRQLNGMLEVNRKGLLNGATILAVRRENGSSDSAIFMPETCPNYHEARAITEPWRNGETTE